MASIFFTVLVKVRDFLNHVLNKASKFDFEINRAWGPESRAWFNRKNH